MSIERSNRVAAERSPRDGAGPITGARMSGNTLLKVGLVGTIVTALCCFTPVLVMLLGALGLTAAIGWLDLLLLPALVLFLVVTGYALWKLKAPSS